MGSWLGSAPKPKFNSNRSAFRFGSESLKTNCGKTIRLFELEAEVPQRTVNSNFRFSIWEPKRIVELDFRFSFWSGTSKTNSKKSTSANDNWFWSGDGERMAQKYMDPAGPLILQRQNLWASSFPIWLVLWVTWTSSNKLFNLVWTFRYCRSQAWERG